MVMREEEIEWERLLDRRQSWLPFDGEPSRTSLIDKIRCIYHIDNNMLEPFSDEIPGHLKIRRYKPNDHNRLEMDYGAPALPLTTITQFFNIENSRRYPQLYSSSSKLAEYRTYNTYVDEARKIMKSLRRRSFGYWDFGDPNMDMDYQEYIHFSSQGVTGCFNKIVDQRIAIYRRLKSEMGDWYPFAGAAVVVPVPTYGLFHQVLRDKTKKAGIKLIEVSRHDDGSVRIESLNKALDLAKAAKFQVLMYYDNTPNNPTGYMRTKEETLRVSDLIGRYSRESVSIIDRLMPYTQLSLGKEKRQLDLSHASATLIIDDMAYSGLEFDPKRKNFGFGQIECSETITLFSLSKNGAPGLRAGMAIANGLGAEVTLNRINIGQLYSEFCASGFVVDALCAAFECVGGRNGFLHDHRKKLRKLHKHRANILETLVEGLDHSESLSNVQKTTLVEKYAEHLGVDIQQARHEIKEGLPLVSLDKRPDSGFFYVMDCSDMRGREFAFYDEDTKTRHYITIEDSYDLDLVLRSYGIETVSAHGMGFNDDTLKARVSISVEEVDLFEFYKRMRKLHNDFLVENPEMQPDFFRPKQHKLMFPNPAV